MSTQTTSGALAFAAVLGAAGLAGCNFDEATEAAQAEILDHTHAEQNTEALTAELTALRAELDAEVAAAVEREARINALEVAVGMPFPGPRTVKARLEELEDAGYITSETDPVASAAGYITAETDPVASNAGYITAETDPVAGAAGYITAETDPVASAAGYITTETDPVASAAGYMLSTDFDIDNDPEASSAVTLQITDAAPSVTVTTPWNVAGCRYLYLYVLVDYDFTGTGTGNIEGRLHLDQAVGQAGDALFHATDDDDAGSAILSSRVVLSRDNPSAATASLGLDAAAAVEGTLTLDVTMLGCIE